MATSTLPAGCSGGRLGRVRRCSHDMVSAAQPGRGYVLWAMDYFLGKILHGLLLGLLLGLLHGLLHCRQGSLKEVAGETPVASQARHASPLHPADDDVGFRRSWATTWVRSSSDNCVNVNGAPRIRTPSRRSGARSCHAPGGMAA